MSQMAGRQDQRIDRKFKVWLSPGSEPMFAELASAENVSSCGLRLQTELPWKPAARVFVKLPEGGVWTRARIAYCQRLDAEHHALGLEFYQTAHRYNLTFRCLQCGRYDAWTNFRSDRVEREEKIKSRIYCVQCAGCGWKGEACGFSAVRILRYKSVEMRAEGLPIPLRPADKLTRVGLKRKKSGAA